jgi:hypothetical protein
MKEEENDNGSVTEYKQRVKECYAWLRSPVDFCLLWAPVSTPGATDILFIEDLPPQLPPGNFRS